MDLEHLLSYRKPCLINLTSDADKEHFRLQRIVEMSTRLKTKKQERPSSLLQAMPERLDVTRFLVDSRKWSPRQGTDKEHK